MMFTTCLQYPTLPNTGISPSLSLHITKSAADLSIIPSVHGSILSVISEQNNYFVIWWNIIVHPCWHLNTDVKHCQLKRYTNETVETSRSHNTEVVIHKNSSLFLHFQLLKNATQKSDRSVIAHSPMSQQPLIDSNLKKSKFTQILDLTVHLVSF